MIQQWTASNDKWLKENITVRSELSSTVVPRKVMQADTVYFFIILFQVMMNLDVLNALEETSVTSRSAFFVSRKNTRLKGHVVKWFYSPSLISCSQLCARKSWCTSTNFKEASKKHGKGTCQLNRHESSVMDEEGKLESLQGVTFSLHLKVCFWRLPFKWLFVILILKKIYIAMHLIHFKLLICNWN